MEPVVYEVPGLDPDLPDVVLKLGGVEYHLCYDYNALVLAEKLTGVQLLSAVLNDIDATKLRGLLWAALTRAHSTLTLEHVGALITPRNMGIIHQALITAWFGSIPEAETVKADPKPQAQAEQ